MNIKGTDPLHIKFLQAGAARVLVPVTPGQEMVVMNFLDNEDINERDRIINSFTLAEIHRRSINSSINSTSSNLAIWQELQTENNRNIAFGNGYLDVKKDSEIVEAIGWDNESNVVIFDERDIGREIYIEGERYEIIEIGVGNDPNKLKLDRVYENNDNPEAKYNIGSVPIGDPWEVRLPTTLITIDNDKGDF